MPRSLQARVVLLVSIRKAVKGRLDVVETEVRKEEKTTTVKMGETSSQSCDIGKFSLDSGEYEVSVLLDPCGNVPECEGMEPRSKSIAFVVD